MVEPLDPPVFALEYAKPRSRRGIEGLSCGPVGVEGKASIGADYGRRY